MRKSPPYGAFALFVVLGWISLVPLSAPTDAFTLTVSHHDVDAGQTFTATARAHGRCQWLMEWNGLTRTTVSRVFETTWTAPAVTRDRRIVLTATCVEDPVRSAVRHRPGPRSGARRSAPRTDRQSLVVRVPPHRHQSIPITVHPGGAVTPPHGGGVGPIGLPNTGGPPFWLVITGFVLVFAGAGGIRRSSAG
ncbi:MAG: hypothetical protein JWP74_1438 [Marmoricola sp.]|nr:hypothetical protein [Marmoricola sp.]